MKLSSARLEHLNTRRQTASQWRRWQSADSRSEEPLCKADDSCRIHPELGGTNGEGFTWAIILSEFFDGRPHDWGEMNVPTFATSRIRRSAGEPPPQDGGRGNPPQAENQFHVLIVACVGRKVQPRYKRRAMHSIDLSAERLCLLSPHLDVRQSRSTMASLPPPISIFSLSAESGTLTLTIIKTCGAQY